MTKCSWLNFKFCVAGRGKEEVLGLLVWQSFFLEPWGWLPCIAQSTEARQSQLMPALGALWGARGPPGLSFRVLEGVLQCQQQNATFNLSQLSPWVNQLMCNLIMHII